MRRAEGASCFGPAYEMAMILDTDLRRRRLLIPPFKGVDAVAAASDLCNPRGFVNTDQYQRNPKYGNVYAVGVCIALAPKEPTPVPTGVPKSGFMIESMVSAAAANIRASRENRPVDKVPTLGALCLADMGDTGMAFVAVPQVPPRNIMWARAGRWVHLAKAAFESYFLRKMRTGNSEPAYERWLLKRLGVKRLEG